MSAALESLMRQPETVIRPRDAGGLVSFALIGGGAALTFVLVSSALVELFPGVDSWLISSLCYGASILPVYLLHRRFTFRSDAAHRTALPRYVAVQAMALLLATLFGYLLYGALALPSLPAALLVIALTSGVNYVVLKGWAFAFERSPAIAAA
jgi:putative flippase GtrA